MEFHNEKDFSEQAAAMLHSADPVVIKVDGKVAGVFIPTPDGELPMDLRLKVDAAATERLHRQRVELGITDEDMEAEIKEFSEVRRAARSRR